MSMSPAPASRSNGEAAFRSSLCATPFLIAKLAVSSLKSVFWPPFACCSSALFEPSSARACRIMPAMSTPLSAPSFSATLALPAERLLQRGDGVAGRGDVERDVAAAFEEILVRDIAQQRPDAHAGEGLLQREGVAVCVHRRRAVERALVEIGRHRAHVEPSARRLDARGDVVRLDVLHLERAHFHVAGGVQRLQRREIDRLLRGGAAAGGAAGAARRRGRGRTRFRRRKVPVDVQPVSDDVEIDGGLRPVRDRDLRLDVRFVDLQGDLRVRVALAPVCPRPAFHRRLERLPGDVRAAHGEVPGDAGELDLLRVEAQRHRGAELALHCEVARLRVEVDVEARELDLLPLRLERGQRELGVDDLLRLDELHRAGDRLALGAVRRELQLRDRELRVEPVLRFGGEIDAGEIDAAGLRIVVDGVALQPRVEAGEPRCVARRLEVERRQRRGLRLEIQAIPGVEVHLQRHLRLSTLDLRRQLELPGHPARDAARLEVHVRQPHVGAVATRRASRCSRCGARCRRCRSRAAGWPALPPSAPASPASSRRGDRRSSCARPCSGRDPPRAPTA